MTWTSNLASIESMLLNCRWQTSSLGTRFSESYLGPKIPHLYKLQVWPVTNNPSTNTELWQSETDFKKSEITELFVPKSHSLTKSGGAKKRLSEHIVQSQFCL